MTPNPHPASGKLREAAKKLDFALASAFFANLPDQAMTQVREAQLELRKALATPTPSPAGCVSVPRELLSEVREYYGQYFDDQTREQLDRLLASAPSAVGEPLAASAESALKRIDARKNETPEEWAANLAPQLVAAGESEYGASTPAPVPEYVVERAAKYLAEEIFRHEWESLRKDGRAADDGFKPFMLHRINARQEDFRDVVRTLAGLLTGSAAEMRERFAVEAERVTRTFSPEEMQQLGYVGVGLKIVDAIRSLPLPQERRDTPAREIDRYALIKTIRNETTAGFMSTGQAGRIADAILSLIGGRQ